MRRSGCSALGCVGLLVLALAVLTGVVHRTLPPRIFPPRPAPGPSPAPGVTQDETGPRFVREDDGDRLRLSFGFSDYEGRPHHFACEVSKQDYDRDLTSFGYFQDDLDRTVGEELRELFERQAEERGVARYVQLAMGRDTSYRWQWTVPGGLPPVVASALTARLRDFDHWLDQDFPREREELTARYLRERGVLLQGEKASVDYAREVEGATGPLASCYEALRQTGAGADDRRLLALFLAFFQDLRYEVPPSVELGRHVLGFRVPTAVLVRGGGDCDSKSAAFCALWRHRPERAILILVPGHALVGVEGTPHAGEAYVRLGNRYFVLCEVAGPGKIPPGFGGISGSFEYVMIEPAGE
ncbi:MAG TPA: hypothetical protein VGM86_03960 [Thermoanaerobaculia bacterium]